MNAWVFRLALSCMTFPAAGSLLVGSSREFSGWSPDASPSIIAAILQRAALFMPPLAGIDPASLNVRVGLRPFAVGGTPIVGPVPGEQPRG